MRVAGHMSHSKAGVPQSDPMDRPVRQMRLMGAPLAVVTEAHAVHAMIAAAEAGEGHWTITANLDHLRRYHASTPERELIEEADLVVADGMPLIWASRLAGEPLPERVSGSSMVWSICEIASTSDLSVFLLGGDPGVAEQAEQVFKAHYSGLRVVGTACPSPGFEHDELELGRLQRQVVEAQPQIVFVALGFPKQDLLIRRLRKALPRSSFLGVGISLSYVTGDVPRAPEWICNLGLEWAYRLAHEPTRRLVRRYLIDGMPFGAQLLASAARYRIRGSRRRGHEAWTARS
jgi:N-acetylglucosaminyldiphosphoundecaprenol N-acetyl-beta-D-mannosaminyltransferase